MSDEDEPQVCDRCGEEQPPSEDGKCDNCDGMICDGCGERGELNENMMCAECEPPLGVCDECGSEAVVAQVGPHAGLCEFCAERAEIGEVCENCQGEGELDGDGLCEQCSREKKRGKVDGTPRWLRDILAERKKKIAEAVKSAVPGGTVDWKKQFGCGHYGCAYAVKERGHPEPRYVVKVTRDPTEGPMQATIARRQKAGEYGFDDGFAIVRGVYRIGDDVQHMGKMWPVYAVVREEVKPVSAIQQGRVYARPDSDSKVPGIYPPITDRQLSNVMSSLNNYKDLAAKWYAEKAKKKPQQRNLDRIEEPMDNALRAINAHAPTLGQVMGILQSDGTPLRDVHGNNVGVRHHEGIVDPEDPKNGLGYIVIFDPGHTPYEGDGKSQIPRMNPGDDSFTYSFPDEHLVARNPAETEAGFHDAFGIPFEAHLAPVWPKERAKYTKKVLDPKGLANYLSAAGDIPQEQFMVALLDTRGMLIGVAIISKGTLNEAAVHPREVFAAAIAARAAGIIGIHNHPSGDVSPSEADMTLSKALSDAGAIVGIPFMDHIVLGRGGEYASLASMGMLPKATRRHQNNPGVDGFGFADDFGQPTEPESPGRFHLDTLKRGDVVRVGKTKWHVFSSKHGAWVVKYGTSGKKMYQIHLGDSTGNRFVVHQMTGSGDWVGDPVAEGDAEVVGWEERA